MNQSQPINKMSLINNQNPIQRKNQKEFIIKRSSPKIIKNTITIGDMMVNSKDEQNYFSNKLLNNASTNSNNVQKNIIGNYGNGQINKGKSDIHTLNKIPDYGSIRQLSRGMSMENDEKNLILEEEKQRKNIELKRELEETKKLLERSRKKNQLLENELKEKNSRIQALEQENASLKSRLSNGSNNNNKTNKYSNRTNGSLRNIGSQPGDRSIEETKNDGNNPVDENQMKSLRFAWRLEAENMLLAHFNQIASLRSQFEIGMPTRSIDFNDPNNINPDNMTYEQLLQLEEKIGSVNKGLSKEDIKKIPKTKFTRKSDNEDDKCSICFCEFEYGDKLRKLPCNHEYHSKCIKPWLSKEKVCPICKKEIINN